MIRMRGVFNVLPRLLGAMSRAPGELQRLRTFLELAANEHEVDSLPDAILAQVKHLFSPDIACVYIRRPAGGDFFASSTVPAEFWTRPQTKEAFGQWSQARGSVGEAIKTGDVVLVADVQAKAKLGTHVPFTADDRSELIIPVVAHDRLSLSEVPVACVVMTRTKGRRYDDRDKVLAQIARVGLVGAFNRAVARDRRERRLDFLRSLGQVLDANDIERVLNSFLESLVRVADARFVTLWLRNGLPTSSDVLVLRAFYPTVLSGTTVTSESFDQVVLSAGSCLSGEVVTSRKAMRFQNVDVSPRFANRLFASRHGLKWFVSCPILDAGGEVQAVLNVWPRWLGSSVNDVDVQTLESYVSPLRTVLRLMDLLREEQELGTQTIVLDAALQHREGGDRTWDTLARGIRDMMASEHCSIFLLDSKSGALRLQGTTALDGLGTKFTRRQVEYLPNEGMTGAVFASNQPYIYYAGVRDRFSSQHASKFREPTRKPSTSILFAPIQEHASGAAIGLLRCTNKVDRATGQIVFFTRQDSTQLVRFSKALSLSILHSQWVAEREKEWEYVLYGLHHELLSPVDTFTTQSRWLSRYLTVPLGDRDEERMKLKVQDLVDSARLADAVVHGLGRLEEELRLQPRAESLPDIVNASVHCLRRTADNERIRVEVDHFGVPKVIVDKAQMIRVVFNLLRNAIKYSDWNKSNRYVRFSAQDEGKFVVLSIEDNGIGIPQGEEQAVFRKFKRGTNAEDAFPQGTGLGLYYCRHVVEAHPGGRIVVRRNANPTVFEVRLPKE